MGREKPIGVLNHKPVTRFRHRQVSGDIAHFQNKHPVFLKRVAHARLTGAILS